MAQATKAKTDYKTRVALGRSQTRKQEFPIDECALRRSSIRKESCQKQYYLYRSMRLRSSPSPPLLSARNERLRTAAGPLLLQEDTNILFDRSYPPPLISLDLDLNDSYEVRKMAVHCGTSPCSFAAVGFRAVFVLFFDINPQWNG